MHMYMPEVECNALPAAAWCRMVLPLCADSYRHSGRECMHHALRCMMLTTAILRHTFSTTTATTTAARCANISAAFLFCLKLTQDPHDNVHPSILSFAFCKQSFTACRKMLKAAKIQAQRK